MTDWLRLALGLVFLIGSTGAVALFVDRPEGCGPPKPVERIQLRELYSQLMMYRNEHEQQWPPGNGEDFLLALWDADRARQGSLSPLRFFPGHEWPDRSKEAAERDLERARTEAAVLGFAAFDDFGDPSLRDQLAHPSRDLVLAASARITPRGQIWLLRGDGSTDWLSAEELVEAGLLSPEQRASDALPFGPDAPIPELRTLSRR